MSMCHWTGCDSEALESDPYCDEHAALDEALAWQQLEYADDKP